MFADMRRLSFFLALAVSLPLASSFQSPPRSFLSTNFEYKRSSLLRSSPTTISGEAEPNAVPASRIRSLTSLDDFIAYIDEAPHDSLAVVKFYATSCPLCKRIEMKYKKMAHFYQTAPIQFAEVAKTVHPELCNTLGVDRFPYIQVYRNGLCVASHGTESDKTFGPVVNDTIQRELTMRPEDWDAFLTAFRVPIQQSADKLQSLRDLRQAS